MCRLSARIIPIRRWWLSSRARLAPLLLTLPACRRKPLDPDQRYRSTVAKSGVMARRISNIEVAAIATVVRSVVVLAVVLLSG